MLTTVTQELNVETFQRLLSYAMEYFKTDPDLNAFGDYFSRYENMQKTWAFCYRVGCHINTNNSLESMHRYIKVIYFQKKYSKTLEKSIKTLMMFIRNKLHDKLITSHRGTLRTFLKYNNFLFKYNKRYRKAI